jgi:hypothetical protein
METKWYSQMWKYYTSGAIPKIGTCIIILLHCWVLTSFVSNAAILFQIFIFSDCWSESLSSFEPALLFYKFPQ